MIQMKTFLKAATLTTFVLVLHGCGGGSSLCGADSQSFTIDFANSSYALVKGTPSTITSTITPESCRSNMTFSSSTLFLNNPPPPGMSITNGNLVGTPTTSGTYTYRMGIDSVGGYQSFGSKPYTRQITVVIAP